MVEQADASLHIIGASLAAMNLWLAVHALGLGAC
jgi:nitroreductase